jgi:hypothetical protein
MKKLTNVSPFLLLLFPVFVVMLFAFTASNQTSSNEEVAQTSAKSNTINIVKTATVILK